MKRAMTFAEFERSLKTTAPPRALAPAVAALWWAKRGDWDKAHTIVMNEDGRDAAWVHAYLHRVEGDAGNAVYWYRQGEKTAAAGALEPGRVAPVAGRLAARGG